MQRVRLMKPTVHIAKLVAVVSNVSRANGQQERKCTFLIVDAEPAIVEALTPAFELHRFRILSADNSNDAYRCRRRYSVDLVISDYMMAGMNGV